MTKILIEIDTDTQRVVQSSLFDDAKVIFCSDSEPNTNGDCLDVIEWFQASTAAAPQPEPVDAIANFLHQFKRHVGGDGEFWLHELEDFYYAISQGELK